MGVPIKQTSGVLFQALRFIHQRPIYLILFPSLALLSSSVPTSAPPRKQPLSLSLPILMLLFSSRIHLQKIIPQFISRYKTDPNLPKNILIFFFIICLYEKKKKQETNEKSITEDLSNLEHFVFLEESKKCVFQNQSCPKSYEALRCCLPV